jgi:DNA-binding SARP family transcriptional activator
MPMRVHLCGNLTVEVDGRDVTAALPGRQGRRLFAYLVANHQRQVRRTELHGVVWPDVPPGSPDIALRSLLTGIRRVVGREAISGRVEVTLDLGPGAWVDVHAAREAGAAADSALAAGGFARALDHAREAVRLTSEPVLADMDGDWVAELRGEVGALHCDQLALAARAALEIGGRELPRAERLARALTAIEPYRESAHALLMEALAAAGNVAEALRVYEDVRVLLRDELGITPSAALNALHARLLRHGAMSNGSTPPPPARRSPTRVAAPPAIARADRGAFVGREPELRWLRERWTAIAEGSGSLILLTGEPGIGKTRTAARFAAEVHEADAEVLHGRVDREPVIPYQPFLEALRPVAPRLGDAGSAAPKDLDRRALFDAATSLINDLARARRVLLIVEDLHWAEKPTLLLLREVVRRTQDQPVMVLATYRPAEVGVDHPLRRLLADLRRELVPHRLELQGLDTAATGELVSDHRQHAMSSDAVLRLWEYTSGNPFFIEELLRSVAGDPLAPDGTAPMAPPESVQEAIMQRLDHLSRGTVGLLAHAALLGQSFSLRVLARLDGRPTDEVLARLDEASRAGFVAEDPDELGRFSFCHALVRETLYALPTAARRRRLHLRAGERLEAICGNGVRAAELAHHYFHARHVGGADRAVRFSREAAREATQVHAYEEAAALLDSALEAHALLADGDRLERIELLLEVGAARWQGGERGAREAFMEAAELARQRGARDVLIRAALGAGGRFYAPGRHDRTYAALLEEALAVVDPAHRALHARLLGRLAEALVGLRGTRCEELGREAVAVAQVSGDGEALVTALMSRHATLLHAANVDARIAVAEDAVERAEGLGLQEFAALSRHWLVHDLMEAGRVDAARDRRAELERLAHELRQPLYVHSSLAWRGVLAQLDGRFAESERLAREGLRLAERAGTPDASANFTAQLLLVRREQGRLSDLLPTLERLDRDGSAVLPWATVLPLAYLEAGARERARDALRAIAADDFAAVPPRFFSLPAVAWLAEAAAELRERAVCARLQPLLAPHLDRLVEAGFSGCWGSARRYAGLLEWALGNREAATRQLDAALAVHRALGAAPLASRTAADLARVPRG